MTPYLSLILPCYNSYTTLEKELPPLIIFLKKQHYSFEIILVDDGSTEEKNISEHAVKYNCVYHRNDTNTGKGSAVKKGMLQAKGAYRIFTDSDIPFEYEVINTILEYLDKKKFDMAIGDRTLKTSSYFTEIPLSRKIGSLLFTFLVEKFVTTGMNDTQCGIKGFRKDIAEDLFGVSRIKGFTFDVECIYIALKRKYNIKRIPVILRNQEHSSVSLLRHSIPMLLDLFFIKYYRLKGFYSGKE